MSLLIDSQPLDIRTLEHAQRDALIVSTVRVDPMPSFPWPDETAWSLAGLNGQQKGSRLLKGGRTPLIPDAEFSAIFQAAWDIVQKADSVLDIRDGVARIEVDASLKRQRHWEARCEYLRSEEWKGGLNSLRTSLTDIRTACYIVVASLSGCRNHELAFVHSNASYRTQDNDGEEYWWMRSRSTKTGEGHAEWMIPAAAAEALRIMDRWALPLQQELQEEIERRRRDNPADTR